jgi:predicted transcriptional regulator YheO
MTDDQILSVFRELMDFLEEVLGPDCEIVLQDLRAPMHIVDIRNAMDPARVPGGEVSDFARLVMAEPEKYSGIKFVTNYKGRNTGASDELSTSTYIIRGGDEHIVGMLCINSSLEPFVRFADLLAVISAGRAASTSATAAIPAACWWTWGRSWTTA